MAVREVRRRRGAELETALLEAAWAELDAVGYDALTYEAVAERARTSRAVLYRRWPSKPALVHAAVVHVLGREHTDPPDTGSLRGDVIAALRQANGERVIMVVRVLNRLADYYRATGESLQDIIGSTGDERGSVLDVVLRRAAERGEIDLESTPDRVLRLPADLFRLEIVMTYGPVPDATILEIVDDVFLPLVAATRP